MSFDERAPDDYDNGDAGPDPEMAGATPRVARDAGRIQRVPPPAARRPHRRSLQRPDPNVLRQGGVSVDERARALLASRARGARPPARARRTDSKFPGRVE